jgi:hypothetical protein
MRAFSSRRRRVVRRPLETSRDWICRMVRDCLGMTGASWRLLCGQRRRAIISGGSGCGPWFRLAGVTLGTSGLRRRAAEGRKMAKTRDLRRKKLTPRVLRVFLWFGAAVSRLQTSAFVIRPFPAFLVPACLRRFWHRARAATPQPARITDGGWSMEKVAAAGFVPRGQETLSGMLEFWICHFRGTGEESQGEGRAKPSESHPGRRLRDRTGRSGLKLEAGDGNLVSR